jgi:predicted flap endonuclease-1-like 5' DNA nuclease
MEGNKCCAVTFNTIPVEWVGMSQETFADPRSNITHPLDTGQVYEDKRVGDELVLVYLSESAALLRDDDENTHRLERRKQFEKYVGSGRYDLQSDSDGSVTTSAKLKKLNRLLAQYEEQDGRKAEHKVVALEEAIDLIANNGLPDDNETLDLESISGIGSKAAASLRANGYTTKGDVRSADRETIMDLDYMGESNTDNLFEVVSNE